MGNDIIKKYILPASIGIGLLVVSFFVYSTVMDYITTNKVKDAATTFVAKWGNFDDESSQKYLDSIKPLVTDVLYKDYLLNADALKKMQAEYGPPTGSEIKITNNTTSVVKNDDNSYTVKITIDRVLIPKEMNLKSKERVEIKLVKKDRWLIDNVSSTKLE
ncbi:MAG: hypothetical protein UT66_C0026G0018 [candidate division CPR2 bacterium GW2011_GWC1_39_9]|uniref:Uncharacterized protein n=1 Tax=candidate division CPR2 bacterium GW2011_GWC2_39_10 TaxID=1618345 RepID=A0A0G0PZY4_UNCC2|nr:MAG: hypothetical protein UT18_C0005G0021 [candidate division CPR2 bacterium GW2011_GWC2_39_10]KKR34266.1 MAG: hypothetical protein UT66_C0026G0018 [candidate division CPR2 bacterium GW2011_GWC1_39_9]